MAKPLCFAVQDPAIIRSTPENNQGGTYFKYLQKVRDKLQTDNRKVRPIESMKEDYEAAARHFIGAKSPEELTDFLQQQGLVVDKEGVSALGQGQNVGDVAKYGYATRAYLEATGGGLDQMAKNLEGLKMNGDSTMAAELAYLNQWQHIEGLMSFAMEVDLKAGREVFARRWLNSKSVDNYAKKRGLSKNEASKEMLDASASVTARIRDGLNSGDRARIQEAKDLIGQHVRLVRNNGGNPVKAAAAAANTAHLGSMIWTTAINGMLSSPATWVVNSTNLIYAMARPMFAYLPAKTWASLTGDADASKAALQASIMVQQTGQAFMDGFQLAWQSARQGKSLYGANADYELLMNGGINPQNVNELLAKNKTLKSLDIQAQVEEGSNMWNLIKLGGDFINVPSRIVQATDDWTKHIVIRQQVAKMAIEEQLKDVNLQDLSSNREMIEAALKRQNEKAFGKNGGLAAYNPEAPDMLSQWQFDRAYEHHLQIKDAAEYVTFQQDNPLARGVEQLLQRAPYLRPFFPFVRTPTNILAQGLADSTPAGAFMKGMGLLKDEGFNPILGFKRIQQEIIENKAKDPEAFYTYMGQVAVGSVAIGAIYQGVMSGSITGGGPYRWADAADQYDSQIAWERAMAAQGKIPYSIKIGDQNFSFERFPEPFAMMLRIAADVGEYSSYMTQQEQDASMAVLAGIFATGLYNASFLTGVENFAEAMLDDDSEGTKKLKMAQGYAETFTPFGGLLKFARTQTNPYRVETARGATSFNDDPGMALMEDILGTGLFARIAARIPGFGGNAAIVDQVTGQKVLSHPGMGPNGMNPLQIAAPILPRGIQGDEVWDRIWKIRGRWNQQTISNVRLNPYEQQRYNELMGEVKLGGRTLEQAIMDFSRRRDVQEHMESKATFNRKAVKVGKRTEIESEFDKIVQRYGSAAEQLLVGENPDVAARQRLDLQIEALIQRGDAEGARAGREELKGLERLARQNKGQPTGTSLPPQLPIRY